MQISFLAAAKAPHWHLGIAMVSCLARIGYWTFGVERLRKGGSLQSVQMRIFKRTRLRLRQPSIQVGSQRLSSDKYKAYTLHEII